MPFVRRLAPWQWLLLLLLAYFALAEALRLWLGLVWAERVAVLLAALGVWAFINGRFLFAYYHAFLASLRTRGLPVAEGAGEEHLLVLAPHPDDEVLAAAGRMRRVALRGGRVTVVYLTSGDAFDLAAGSPLPSREAMRRLALRRMVEAWRGLEALGLGRGSALFLGFPDQGLFALFTTHYYLPWESPYTGLKAVAYPGCYRPGLPYTGKALEGVLLDLLRELRPSRILLPSPLDAHRDHQATAYFGMQAAAALGMEGRLEYYIVHGGTSTPCPRAFTLGFPSTRPPGEGGFPGGVFPLRRRRCASRKRPSGPIGARCAFWGGFSWPSCARTSSLAPCPSPPRRP
ncbi:Mycothiol S-conjugate amidase [Thermus brockianus]|uniref:Mycothiol S-conjugate amidase n=1 Tax=Thermus brockianus TaxID=56956 RepID=A0A1J0LW03_THEBO|nr:Mycothiol S-conjugate amidase [Thermus brockianus]